MSRPNAEVFMRQPKLSELSSWWVRRLSLTKVRLTKFGSTNMSYLCALEEGNIVNIVVGTKVDLLTNSINSAVLRSIQSWKGHANVSVSSGFPYYAVYLVGNILIFSSDKLENCPFKTDFRKAGFHCTTVKWFAPFFFVLNSGDVRCWVMFYVCPSSRTQLN